MHAIISDGKEAMDFKESEVQYMGGLGKGRGREKCSRQLYQREKSTIKIKDPIQMLSYVVWPLFLIVKLSKFGAKYNQRMEGTPGREFFAWFEVNESTFSPDL